MIHWLFRGDPAAWTVASGPEIVAALSGLAPSGWLAGMPSTPP